MPSEARPGLVYHVMSAFDPVQLDRIWPAWAREPSVGLVVTLYDLILLQFQDRYLVHPPRRASYLTRLGMFETADAVVAISDAVARDGVDHLGLAPERLFAIGAGCSAVFRPPAKTREEVFAGLRAELPGLRPDFFLYAGGADHRKNLELLVAAYGALPSDVRRAHQLVLGGRHHPDDTRGLVDAARRSGVGEELIMPGRLSDDLLVRLYQSCLAFVLPSLYEGFGLPALEAMSCGAAVVASDASSLPEVVTDPEARFDPKSVDAVSRILARIAGDPRFVERLRRLALPTAARHTWRAVAERTIPAYECVQRRRVGALASIPERATPFWENPAGVR
jgi:glycosyltransferase involved in cell wall biosynthesis